MDINKSIAKRILEIRKEKALTAERLAWTANLSKSCVSYAEKGTKDIKISTISALCDALDISLSEFFSTFNNANKIDRS